MKRTSLKLAIVGLTINPNFFYTNNAPFANESNHRTNDVPHVFKDIGDFGDVLNADSGR